MEEWGLWGEHFVGRDVVVVIVVLGDMARITKR